MKTYQIEQNIISWFFSNVDLLFKDILIACEDGLNDNKDNVVVVTVRSLHGVTEIALHGVKDIADSLNKCIEHFVKTEEYEMAARARDCGLAWLNKGYIKKN